MLPSLAGRRGLIQSRAENGKREPQSKAAAGALNKLICYL